MSTPSGGRDPRRELLARVAGSVVFQKTWRLREMLLFLCERVLRDPEHPPREQEIGAAVFGRGQDFDPSVDPLVRVQTSQLRKRLLLYFSTEGAGEPMVIEIPKGAYAPAFRDRDQAEPVNVDAAPPRPRWLLGAACAALLVAVGVLVVQNRQLRRAAQNGPRPSAHVERLWRTVLGHGLPSYVVVGDGSLSVFLDTTRRHISPSAYQRRQYDTQYHASPPKAPPPADPPDVVFSRGLIPLPLTGVADASLAHHVGAMGAFLGVQTHVLSARDATPDLFRTANVVLSGPTRANPWTELFEDGRSFRFSYNKGVGVITNRAPQAGEPPEYRAVPEQTGYCRIAHTANLEQTGSVVLVTGSDLASTRAGFEMLTDDRAVADLSRALGLDERAPFPHFEAVLQVRFVANAPLTYERVALRARTPPARPTGGPKG